MNNLTDQEKEKIKQLIVDEIASLQDTFEAEKFSDAIYFYAHLYDPKISNFGAKSFWQMDTGPRDIIWVRMEEALSP